MILQTYTFPDGLTVRIEATATPYRAVRSGEIAAVVAPLLAALEGIKAHVEVYGYGDDLTGRGTS